MFISGFTIARNVIKADYPIKEAIYSILPLCDELIVAVGKSDDNTLEYIQGFNEPKIKIIETVWDDTMREGGKVLAIETNKAFEQVNPKADWCIYIQADEVLHQDDYENLKAQLFKFKDDPNIDGLLFDYVHFYGSYDYVGDSRTWYRKEIRAIKNNKNIQSYKDAQGFRKNGEKLNVKPAFARVHHYGWVKHPKLQLEKLKQARKLWHSDEFLEKEYAKQQEFDFNQIDSLALYQGTHPELMKQRIQEQNWEFNYPVNKKKMGLKKWFLYWIEQKTGWRIGENRNYKIV